MWNLKSLVAIGAVLLFFGVAVQPAIAQPNWNTDTGKNETRSREVPAPFKELSGLVTKLKEASTDPTDTDRDGLVDSIELVIGTDPNNTDSDFDKLNDSAEVGLGLDPRAPDSNGDKLPDYFEVTNISADLDGDGTPNGWDWDNDNDGVMDGLDLSPNAKTATSASFGIRLITGGKPTYVNFQVSTKNPEHLKQYSRIWNWPDDDKGQMQDLDRSVDDVTIAPLLALEADALPDQDKVAGQGIIIAENTANIPLMPVLDLGNVVGFEGRMFFPASGSGLNVSMTLKMSWRVTGLNDKPVKSLQAQNGKLVSADPSGAVRANASVFSLNETYEVIETSKDNAKVSFRAVNGRYLAAGKDNVLEATGTKINSTTEFAREEKGGGKIALKSVSDGLYVSLRTDGKLAAEAKTVTEREKFVLGAAGFRSENIPLAIYPEEFLLTGMSIEEDYGDDLGQFYGGNVTTLVAANLMLAYDFLRNATTTVSDMPGVLGARGMVLQNRTMTVSDRDELSAQLGGKPVYDIVRTLPEHARLPVISIFEDRTATLEMSELASGSYILGTDLTANVSNKPVIGVRTLKTNWYDTDNDTLLDAVGTVSALMGLGLEQDALTMLTGLMMVWNNGERIVVRVGPDPEDFNPPEVTKVTDWVLNIQKYGLNMTMKAILAVKVALTVYAFVNIGRIPELFDLVECTSTIGLMKASWNYVGESMGWISSGLKTLGNVLNIVGCAVTVIIAGVTAWLMMKAYGYSEYGVSLAVTNFIFTAAYAIVLCVLAFCVPVGTVIAAIIGFLDFLCFLIWKKSWIAEGFSWLANQFVKRSERTTPGLDPIDTSIDLLDKQRNGLDQGDRVTYIARLYGNITKTSKGNWNDMANSFIYPTLYYVNGAGQKVNNAVTVESEKNIGDKKVTVYNSTAWTEPATPAVNYPFTTMLSYTYHTYYQVRYFFVYTKTYSETKSKDLDPNTIYFDVMPSSFDGLVGWKGLTLRDSDGDGINNTAETRSDPQLYDTDADGLNDRFELDAGTDPRRPDTDGDGLGDLQEMRLGTDPGRSDSDGDGLSDGVEHAGWVVNFNYSGKELSWHIASDPTLNDTDCDGLDDPTERIHGFNPISADTDGNGVPDIYDNTVHKIAYSYSMENPPGWWSSIRVKAVERDGEGYLYILFELVDYYRDIYYEIMKYYPNGNRLGTVVNEGVDVVIDDFVLGSSGDVYVYGERILPNGDDGVVVYDADGPMLRYLRFDYPAWSAWKSIAADDKNDFLYSANYYNGTITRYNLSTGAILKTWEPGPSANRYFGKMTFDAEGYLYCADWELGLVYKFDSNLDLVRTFNESASGMRLAGPSDVDVAPNGDLFILENHGHKVVKLDRTGHFYTSFGSLGTGNDNLYYPNSIAWADDFIVVADGLDRVQVLSHTVTHNPPKVVSFTDADGDGLTDAQEKAGWNVTVKNATGTLKYKVTSEALLPDTDGDRLPDLEESIAGTDPRKPDTDGDGVSDYDEYKPGGRAGAGTNATDSDTDGDGLGDGVEKTFGSDPMARDTDDDGLFDDQELLHGTDPQSTDTDWDGLNDSQELQFGSSPLRPDSDEDLMADGMEYQAGADPNSADTDGDGLTDGYEVVYGTNATDPDTDGEGLSDGFEVESLLDPLSNDTDGDGVNDLLELERHTNPFYNDTDEDGIPDALDTDYELPFDGEVWLVADQDSCSAAFSAELSKSVRVFEITPQEFVERHRTEKNIVLVGRPDAGNGTAGALIGDLLVDSGDVLDGMLSGADESVVRYGCWAPEQTVVMLARARATESDMVLGMFKSLRMTVSESSVTARYLNIRDSFAMDGQTTVQTTDAAVWVQLDSKATFDMTVSRYDSKTAPVTLTHANGLEPGEVAMGRYLEIKASDNLQGPGVDLIAEVQLQVLFTTNDLDRTGDGDADDPQDLNASGLSLFWFDETAGKWVRLSETLGWVKGFGVNTANLTLYGKEYAGYIWTNVSHLSLLGVAGRPGAVQTVVARAGDDTAVFVDDELVLNGSLSSGNGPIVNYTWALQYGTQTVNQYGTRFSFVPHLPGTYTATLTVTDPLGMNASDTVSVTVKERPDGRWSLAVGPVKDESGNFVQGAIVRITAGNEALSNSTDSQGMTRIGANVTHIGQNVTVYVEKEGFVPIVYTTRITTERRLETAPPALVRAKPGDTVSILLGPVKDQNGKAVMGVEVLVTIGNTTYSTVTDALGMARIAVPLSSLGKTADVTLRKTGYKQTRFNAPIAFTTTPVATPALEKTTKASAGKGGSPESIMAMSVLILVLAMAAIVLMVRRPPVRGKDEEKNRRGAEEE